jgi:hypothetical protein
MMAKKPRPPRLEKSCPLPATHTRLHHVHEHWHRTAADYADPDDFVTNLNAALVMLRSVTNVLNKEQSRIPDFEAWYTPHIERYKDPVMRWLVKARNFVEKQGDLELHSQARVTLLGSYGEPPQADILVPPLLTQHEIAQLIAPRFSDEAKRSGLLAVERRWVAADLPEHELLDVLAYGYGVIAEIVADAHKQCGFLMQTFGDEAHEDRPLRRTQLGGRLSCMVAHAKLRTAYVHLAQGEVVEWETRTRSLSRNDVKGWELPEGMLEAVGVHVPGTHILDTAEGLARAAKAFMQHAGYHEPMAWVFETRDDAPEICGLNASDHATQTLMMQSVADEVERLRAEGVVFASEICQSSGDGDELLVAAMTDDGGRRQWRSRLSRDAGGHVMMGATVVEDGIVPEFMNAIQRVWVRLGRMQL